MGGKSNSSTRKFWNRKSRPLSKSRVCGLSIVPRSFPAHISRALVRHGKIRSGFARLRSKVERVLSRGKTASLPAFQQSANSYNYKRYLSKVRNYKYILFSYNNHLKAFFKLLLFLEEGGGAIVPLGYTPGYAP